jgi:UTP-glucose-1-phosphate uridylyltransferase
MNQPTLVVLAAGIGSRYGGLKQMDPIGPAGETIIDYSIYDAIRAGFGRVVFVIRHEIEADFKAVFGQKFEQRLPVMYAYQELEKIPVGFAVPPQRKKPWGTGHAVLMAEGLTEGNFAVINADDFYGAVSFQRLAAYLQTAEDAGKADYTMVGFILRNTLSDFGSVARGVCHQNEQGFLEHVVELTKIERAGDQAQYTDESGQVHPLSGAEIVSMNMWGFTPSLFAHLRQQFATFMVERGHEKKSEFFLPSVVNNLVTAGQAQVKVLSSSDAWFGITYQQDRPHVIEKIQALVAQGVYPAKLWA